MKNHKRTMLLYSLICFLMAVCTIELILRTTHIFNANISCGEPDAFLSWRPAPNCNYWYNKENDHPITWKYNSHGWRDEERAIKKLPNTYRVAILGDSYVEAMQVELSRTFSALAENQLNEGKGIEVEILNFGRSGFTQTEELFILKNDVEKFSPDMVVLFFLPKNDIQDVSRETSPDLMRPFYIVSDSGELILDTSFTEMPRYKIRCLINKVKRNSALISLITGRYDAFKMISGRGNIYGDKEREKQSSRLDGFLSLCTNDPDPKYLRSYALNKLLIKEIAEYCGERNIHFMLVTIDNVAYIPDIEEKYKSINPSFNGNFFEDDLKSYSQLLNIDYLGLQRIFRQFYENEMISLHWDHWNYRGHEVVADALTEKLRSIIYSDAEQRKELRGKHRET